MIPIYTTDTVPIDGQPPVTNAWPVWSRAPDIGQALDALARMASGRGAHAVIGLRPTAVEPDNPYAERFVLMGAAVVLGG
ncbi:hypothetical protein ACQEU6_29975 [Spirillospora sp. CA-108201]